MFQKQSDAIEFSKCFSGELKVFAFETDNNGRRNYVVCHPERFWILYDAKDVRERHAYEVIEQSDVCKLYFDLEFKRNLNVDTDSASLMRKFKALLVSHLKETFDLELSESNILDLDSSTDEKFSRHLIVDDVVFKNNFHVGNYVRSFCSKFEEDKSVLVRLSEKDVGVFVDLGVYTKNRNFRLFLSSKFGKLAILKLDPSNCQEFSSKNDKDIFLKSLLTFCPNISPEKSLSFGSDNCSFSSNKNSSSNKISSNRRQSSGYTSTPFPEIDEFFRNLISEDSGFIRKWSLGGNSVCHLVILC